MWSSNGTPEESQSWTREQVQWSAQQSNYCLSVPHDSVDWAQLAKQWIQMQKQTQQQTQQMPQMQAISPSMSSMPPMPPMGSPIHPQPPPMPPLTGHFLTMNHNMPQRPHMVSEDNSRPVYQTPIEANNWIRNRPPPPPMLSLPPLPSLPSMPSLPPPLLPTPMNLNFHSSFNWRAPTAQQIQSSIMPSNDMNKNNEKINANIQSISLDAAKKKNLPNWLREGLEKMEREKNKKMEKEKEEHERREKIKAIRDKEEELRREIELEQKMASNYESDEDEEDRKSNDANDSDEEREDLRLTEEKMVWNLKLKFSKVLFE